MMIAKTLDGALVTLIAYRVDPPFSPGSWLLINRNIGTLGPGADIKWIPADTRFEWVREYCD